MLCRLAFSAAVLLAVHASVVSAGSGSCTEVNGQCCICWIYEGLVYCARRWDSRYPKSVAMTCYHRDGSDITRWCSDDYCDSDLGNQNGCSNPCDDGYICYFGTNTCVAEPTVSPTAYPTQNPNTDYPSRYPTSYPSGPTVSPTSYPSQHPTAHPTNAPTRSPTRSPTRFPTRSPTNEPTHPPTHFPTNRPTNPPTHFPTLHPTKSPTKSPTLSPTQAPTECCRCLMYPGLTHNEKKGPPMVTDRFCCNRNYDYDFPHSGCAAFRSVGNRQVQVCMPADEGYSCGITTPRPTNPHSETMNGHKTGMGSDTSYPTNYPTLIENFAALHPGSNKGGGSDPIYGYILLALGVGTITGLIGYFVGRRTSHRVEVTDNVDSGQVASHHDSHETELDVNLAPALPAVKNVKDVPSNPELGVPSGFAQIGKSPSKFGQSNPGGSVNQSPRCQGSVNSDVGLRGRNSSVMSNQGERMMPPRTRSKSPRNATGIQRNASFNSETNTGKRVDV